MDQEKLNSFTGFVTETFQRYCLQITGLNFEILNSPCKMGDDTIAVIVGISGNGPENKGRIVLMSEIDLSKVATPYIHSTTVYFVNKHGPVMLNIENYCHFNRQFRVIGTG